MNLHFAVLVRVRFRIVTVIATLLCSSMAGFGQTNSWTSTSSGHWEDASWSLGLLPTASQSVFITNSGSKAVGIFPTTPVNFPAAMTVSNLTISAPDGFQNTLLLNFAGTSVPLTVLSNCVVGTNGRIASFSSGLRVEGELIVSNGSFLQTQGVTAVDTGGFIQLIDASVALTNAAWTFSSATLQGQGSFVQSGGSVAGGNIYLQSGTYDFFGGELSGTLWVGYSGNGTFIQRGGENSGDISVGAAPSFSAAGDGTYVLVDGTVQASNLMVGVESESFGTFAQFGGTISNQTLILGGFNPFDVGFYSLSNGVLSSHGETVESGSFTQTGGSNLIDGTLGVFGFYDDYEPIRYASFSLQGGFLKSTGISSGIFGPFSQSGGTNYVAGDLSATGGGFCGFGGGLLAVSNIMVYLGRVIDTGDILHSSFSQGGGVLWVTNALTCFDECNLNGGITVAPRIILHGSMQIGPSPAEVITNNVSFELAGALSLTNTTQNLAPVILTGNSGINFESGNCAVRFGGSGGKSWVSAATLTISNWDGSLQGGGMDEIFFGDSASGLTAAQLQQIQFVNPAGLPLGSWFAKLLATGELVPTEQPTMTMSMGGTNFVVQWPPNGGYVLQGATNANGPFEDIPNAVSPFTNNATQSPSRYFRLRHP